MRVGLYFGSFNPIHIGHLIIAEYVQNNTDIDQVWFVVSPQNPFKQQSSLLNSYDRLHMVRLAIENNPRLQVSDIEFKLPVPSYTADTLTYLHEKYPDYGFEIILGSDSFQNITRWKNADFLLENYGFKIYNRPEFPVEHFYNAKYELLNAPLLQISSTFIRKQIKARKSIRYLVPDKIFQEIMENQYYR